MVDLRFYWYKIRTTPLRTLAKRACTKAGSVLHQKGQSLRDSLLDTRLSSPVDGLPNLLLDAGKLDVSGIDPAAAETLVQMWLAHRFDLLGSGWVRCGFYDNAPGFEGNRYEGLVLEPGKDGTFLEQILLRRHLAASKRIWALIGEESYQPIDWQKDLKSGYRWDARVWYLKQRWADRPGGDIKMPWELSRLQHLPRMAVFSLVLPDRRETLYREFRRQCLDFFAQNPPRMGVNWMCTMDVGIRTANLVLAYSLFASLGVNIDPDFQRVFITSIYEHCYHIFNNLEWSEILTSNHYLADVAGLLFGAAFLPVSPTSRAWLDFAVREVQNEILKQFYEEGSNFEGSTAYHRLSSDMAAYCTALLLGMGEKMLGNEISGRLEGAAAFLAAVTRPDGDFTQVGDNDSGLFFHLSPTGALYRAAEAKERYASLAGYRPEEEIEPYWDEDLNDGRPTAAALGGLFRSKSEVVYRLEQSVVSALAHGRTIEGSWQPPAAAPEGEAGPLEHQARFEIPAPGRPLTENIRLHVFPRFGVYIFRSDRLYLLVNASDNGQKGNAGHAHNDKLSFELVIDGKVLFEDPGTYVYTASSSLRDSFRSVRAHNTIQTGMEQSDFLTTFAMRDGTKCRLLTIENDSICVEATYKHVIHRRRIRILPEQVEVTDFCNVPFQCEFTLGERTAGYGKRWR